MKTRFVSRVLIAAGLACVAVIGASAYRLTSQASASPASPQSSLQGISAAEDPAAPGPDATALAELESDTLAVRQGMVPSEARELGTLGGHRVYAVPMTSGGFCFFEEGLGMTCKGPMTSSDPVLLDDLNAAPGQSDAIAIGVAEDGVASLTVTENGATHTFPVHGNVFYFAGAPSNDLIAFTNIVANYADGHSVAVS